MQFLWDQGFPPIQIRNAAYNSTIGVHLKAAQVTIQQKRRVGYYQTTLINIFKNGLLGLVVQPKPVFLGHKQVKALLLIVVGFWPG